MNSCPKSCIRPLAVIALALIGLLGETQVLAQTVPGSQKDSSGQHLRTPMLDGHRFVAFTTLPSPFLGTFIRNSLGTGMSSGLTFPPVVIGGTEYQFVSGTLAFSQLKFEYQHCVKNWLAPFLSFQLFGRLGTDTQSLLYQGVTVMTAFELGWLIKIWQADNMILSGALSLQNASSSAADLAGFVRRIIVDGQIRPDNTIYHSVPITLGVAGLRYAYAVNDMLGLTAVANLAYGESPTRGSPSRFYHKLGISADFDFAPRHGVPIGLGAAFTQADLAGDVGVAQGHTETLTVRISYTGASDFNCGLEVSSLWQGIEGVDTAFRYTSGMIDFQYYF